ERPQVARVADRVALLGGDRLDAAEHPLPRQHLEHEEDDVDGDQPLADLAALGDGGQEGGAFAAVGFAVVDTHGRSLRQDRGCGITLVLPHRRPEGKAPGLPEKRSPGPRLPNGRPNPNPPARVWYDGVWPSVSSPRPASGAVHSRGEGATAG